MNRKTVVQSLFLIIFLLLFSACTSAKQNSSGIPLKVAIIHSLGGDFPVAQLDVLPVGQRLNPVGYIVSQQQLAAVLRHIESGDTILPAVDFSTQMVLFARNTRFYNRLSIGAVTLVGEAFEVLSMSTMSARPIEDKVAMSLVVVERGEARFIVVNGEKVELSSN